MVEAQVVSVSLAQGLDTKTDPKQVQSEYLLIQNAIYQTLEQLNLRAGFTALSKTTYTSGTIGSITAGFGLASLNQALLEHDGQTVWSRVGDLTEWTYAGQKRSVSVTKQAIGSSSSAYFVSLGMARASNGIELYVWIDRTNNVAASNNLTGIAYFLAFDTNNNVTVYQPFGFVTGILATGITSVRADVVGSNFFITTSDGTAIKIYKASVTAPNFTVVTATTVDAAAAVNLIDTCVSSSAVYILGSKVYKVDAASLAVTSSAASTYGPVSLAGINFDSVQNNVWVANYSGTNVQAAILNANLTVVQASTTVGTVAGTPNGGALSLYVSNNQGYIVAPTNAFNSQVLISALFTGAAFTTVQSVLASNSQICSKPTLGSDGFLYVIGIFVSNNQLATNPSVTTAYNPLQPTTFLLKIDLTLLGGTFVVPVVAAKALALQTGIPYGFEKSTTNNLLIFYAPSSILQLTSNSWIYPNLQTTQDVVGLIGVPTLAPSSVVVKNQFDFSVKMRKSNLANSIYTTGGYVSNYDTAQEVENNFHLFPEITGATQTSQSPAVATGTYGYAAIYRWVDAIGQIHRSAPSFFTFSVTSGPQKVTLAVNPITLTDKNNYFLDLYRTQNGGTIYYFLQTAMYSRNGIKQTGTLDDTNSMDQVSTLELYTTGGEVENISSPATNFMVDYKNRQFSIPSENPYELWYSKQVITNFPVEYSDLFTINLEARGGPATGLAPLDDKLIILKQNALFFMVGDGPSPSGANNDFSYPQIIPSDSGCTEPDSIVGFPGGVCYKGSKGIYLIDRSLQVQYIGAAVEAYNQFSITSATLDNNLNLIRYTLSNGMSLVYDYFVKKWSTFSNISAVDSVVGNGVYYYLKADGTFEQETPGTYNDDASLISMSFTSGWIAFAKIQGFQRAKKLLLLGKNYSPCILTVGIAYDFDPTIVQTVTITNPAALDPWQWRVFLDRQKCEAVQLSFIVTPTAPFGKALALSNISFEVGVKKGFYKLPAAVSTS